MKSQLQTHPKNKNDVVGTEIFLTNQKLHRSLLSKVGWRGKLYNKSMLKIENQ
jgi:hypothetical protein